MHRDDCIPQFFPIKIIELKMKKLRHTAGRSLGRKVEKHWSRAVFLNLFWFVAPLLSSADIWPNRLKDQGKLSIGGTPGTSLWHPG